MCGIIGCTLRDQEFAARLIREGLERLEYRGYDSAGIVTVRNSKLHLRKDAGRIHEIHERLHFDDTPGSLALGHTRWATHGAPLRVNAHPHIDCTGTIGIVHNGVIENFMELRRELEAKGHVFISRTDSEAIAHLVEESAKNGNTLEKAVRDAVLRLQGSYALGVVSAGDERKLVVARKDSPLMLGIVENGHFIASDIPAILPLTNRVVEVSNGELVVLTPERYEIRRIHDWSIVNRESKTIGWTMEVAQKQGYPHFMLKEIHEQPEALRNALLLQDRYLDLLSTLLDRAREVFLLASGTSYNACVVASYMFSKLACLPTHPVIASEFTPRYGDAVNVDSTVFAVSQSGETADVLQAIEHARMRAATILGLTNVMGSTLTRIARAYICQQSGPEIGVAATKTFTAQVAVLAQLALRLAKMRGKVSQDEIDEFEKNLRSTPLAVHRAITSVNRDIARLAEKYKDRRCFFFLGRGVSSATALEGALKLLEISRLPTIAYPAGESKHGPISLIEAGFPVVFTVPRDVTRKAVLGNIVEMRSRGASVIAIGEEGDEEVMKNSDDYIAIPTESHELLTPILYVVPLQLFAYHMALERNCDPDRPLNLAKSVTVP